LLGQALQAEEHVVCRRLLVFGHEEGGHRAPTISLRRVAGELGHPGVHEATDVGGVRDDEAFGRASSTAARKRASGRPQLLLGRAAPPRLRKLRS